MYSNGLFYKLIPEGGVAEVKLKSVVLTLGQVDGKQENTYRNLKICDTIYNGKTAGKYPGRQETYQIML